MAVLPLLVPAGGGGVCVSVFRLVVRSVRIVTFIVVLMERTPVSGMSWILRYLTHTEVPELLQKCQSCFRSARVVVQLLKYYNLVKKERCPNNNHGPTFMSNMQQRSIVKIQQVSEKHRQNTTSVRETSSKYNNCQTLQYRPLPTWHPTTVDLRGVGGAGGGGGLFPLLQVPVVHG